MNNVNNFIKGNIILDIIKYLRNCLMVFDKILFLMISGVWVMCEREKNFI